MASLDRIDQALPDAFERARQRMCRDAEADGIELNGGHDVRLVGYSDRMQTMVCITFEQVRFDRPLTHDWFNDGLEVAPWHEDQGSVPDCRTTADLFAIGVAQLAFAVGEFGPAATVGGPLLMAEVSRDGVKTVSMAQAPTAPPWRTT